MKIYVGTITSGEYGDQETKVKYVGDNYSKCLKVLRKERKYIYSYIEIWENEELIERLYKHNSDNYWVKEN